MKIDIALPMDVRLQDVPAMVKSAEEIGFDAVWTNETQREPFFPLVLAAEHTQRIHLGTSIAVAFARSPTVLAHVAWDLAAFSKGRFILGLGTQVKAHIERRFGMTWESPAPKLREMILAMRALWDTWQNGTPLNFRGKFFKLTLMSPFFNPGPIEHPKIPVFIAGVNPGLCRVAGEVCDGFHVHPFHTAKYLREVTLPNITQGLQKAGRQRADIELSSAVFVCGGQDSAEIAANKESARRQISFYASTPSYRPVFETHGWGEVAERLSSLAARAKWDEMPSFVTDEMLAEVAVIGPHDELPGRIMARYNGLLDRVTYYEPFKPEDEGRWRRTVEAFRKLGG